MKTNKLLQGNHSYIFLGLIILIGSMALFKDSDGYFLIETGRKLVSSGLVQDNPWTVVPSLKFIPQQWLFQM